MVHPYGVRMDDLARLEMPTLIIVGEHDMIKDRQTREMAAHIPRCRVEVFATATISLPQSSRHASIEPLWNSF